MAQPVADLPQPGHRLLRDAASLVRAHVEEVLPSRLAVARRLRVRVAADFQLWSYLAKPH
jgi:hypothetical protein